MRKFLLTLTLITAVFAVMAMPVQAEDFPVTVDIPAASTANFFVFKIIPGQPYPTTPEPTNDLDFDVTLDTALGVYFGDHYYAIDVAPQGGSGQLNVQVSYTDNLNQNPGVNTGLSIKSIGTIVRANPDDSETELRKEVLRDIATTVLATELTGGFMRMYVGLATGDAANNEPTAAEPFTVGDNSGIYNGTITMTTTQP